MEKQEEDWKTRKKRGKTKEIVEKINSNRYIFHFLHAASGTREITGILRLPLIL